jgi:hypothetical protein
VAVAWHYTHLARNPLVATSGNGNHAPPKKSVGDFDQFQQDLADRVLQRYGGGKDFSVIVATTAYPLGTLLRSLGSVPADIDDCIPIPLQKPFPAQHLFPSYTMSSDTALAANVNIPPDVVRFPSSCRTSTDLLRSPGELRKTLDTTLDGSESWSKNTAAT